jgi:hypothetical protein
VATKATRVFVIVPAAECAIVIAFAVLWSLSSTKIIIYPNTTLHFLRLHLESLRHSIVGIILFIALLFDAVVISKCLRQSILRGERDGRIVDSEQELNSSFTVLEDVAILRLHPDSAIVLGFLFVLTRG